ncbi:MAG: hypothetical protein HON55_03470 [Legionellales bacterium]|jgi:hypothetical protein|nr:hypothetical protein [Legionellales bacterium]
MEKKTVRGTFKRFFDVSSWLGTAEIKRNTSNIRVMVKDLFTVRKAERRETFADAVARYKLNKQDLLAKQDEFFKVAMVYLAVCICDIVYAIYLYYKSKYMPALMASAFAFVLFSMFFRQHFWYTQIKHQRLGFTFQQWVVSLFK